MLLLGTAEARSGGVFLFLVICFWCGVLKFVPLVLGVSRSSVLDSCSVSSGSLCADKIVRGTLFACYGLAIEPAFVP